MASSAGMVGHFLTFWSSFQFRNKVWTNPAHGALPSILQICRVSPQGIHTFSLSSGLFELGWSGVGGVPQASNQPITVGHNQHITQYPGLDRHTIETSGAFCVVENFQRWTRPTLLTNFGELVNFSQPVANFGSNFVTHWLPWWPCPFLLCEHTSAQEFHPVAVA